MKKIISTNPGDGYKVIGEVIASSKEVIDGKVTAANNAKSSWGTLSVEERIPYLTKAKELFLSRKNEIADLIHQEIGTPIIDVIEEIEWDFDYWQWFLDNVKRSISPETTFETATSVHKIIYEPICTVAVITPWNLPFDLFLWGVIPNLLVGNTVVYKAAEECALSGQLFEEIMNQVGLPQGVFNAIHGDGAEGEYLTNSTIDSIWFTGSTEVGQKIFATAGKKFIRTMLELGGSNPVVVCADADLELAANKIISKRFMFSGQTCDADKRLIVHQSIKDQLVKLLVEKVSNLALTPLASSKQLDLIVSQVNDSVAKGASIVVGGKQPDNIQGAYYLPTILENVKSSMRVWNEEVFGPVLPLMTFTTNEEALALANATIYGLGSQVFTKDEKSMNYFSYGIQAGNVDINGVGHFIPQNPFGGYKNSGMGREHGIHGFRELCQIKTVSKPKSYVAHQS